MGLCLYPRMTRHAIIPYIAHKVNEIASECRDNEYLLERFTVGGRPLNRDPNHGVWVRRERGTTFDLPPISVIFRPF